MKQINKDVYNRLINLRNIEGLNDLGIYYWKPPESIGDQDRFIIYSNTSSEDSEGDDLTYYRQINWSVVFYSKNYGEDISDDLEECMDVPVTIERNYEDTVANMMKTVYSFIF